MAFRASFKKLYLFFCYYIHFLLWTFFKFLNPFFDFKSFFGFVWQHVAIFGFNTGQLITAAKINNVSHIAFIKALPTFNRVSNKAKKPHVATPDIKPPPAQFLHISITSFNLWQCCAPCDYITFQYNQVLSQANVFSLNFAGQYCHLSFYSNINYSYFVFKFFQTFFNIVKSYY